MPHPTAIALAQKYPDCGITEAQFDKVFQVLAAENRTNSISFELVDERITGAVQAFEPEGLTPSLWLKAALKDKCLFYYSYRKSVENIDGVVEALKILGLTRKEYLWAALKRPILFFSLPKTIVRKFKGGAKVFKPMGLTRKEYLAAALILPALFYSLPETIKEHSAILAAMRASGLVFFGKKNSDREFLNGVMHSPKYLTRSYDNYLLRAAYVAEFPERRQSVLTRTKQEIIAALIGKDPVAYSEAAPDKKSNGPQRSVATILGGITRISSKLEGVLGCYAEIKRKEAQRVLYEQLTRQTAAAVAMN